MLGPIFLMAYSSWGHQVGCVGAPFLAAEPFPNAKAALDKKKILRIQIILVYFSAQNCLLSLQRQS